MAIKMADYKKTKYPNLYKSISKHPKYEKWKYVGSWKKPGQKQVTRKVLGFYPTDKIANDELEKYVDAPVSSKADTLEKSIGLKKYFFQQIELETYTNWTKQKVNFYNLHIHPFLGEKHVRGQGVSDVELRDIKETQIKQLIKHLEKQGLSKRSQKTVIEVLNPLFKTAIRDKIIFENPCEFIKVKRGDEKKVVTDATEKWRKIYAEINNYYSQKNHPYWHAFFLLALQGRRKGEIQKLKWKNVDFKNRYYWIEDTKVDESQKYELWGDVAEQLHKIPAVSEYVFANYSDPNKPVYNPYKQVKALREHMNMPEFSLHYLRNVLVGFLAEQGMDSIHLSAVLGHKDTHTIKKYLTQNYHNASGLANKILDEVKNGEA